MSKKWVVLVSVLSFLAGMAQAAPVDLKALGINADFDDWLAVGNDGAKWASEITSNDLNGDGLNDMYDALPTDDEFYTNPSSFGSGWQSNGTAGLNGKYGLQHPKRSAQNDMSAPFNGDFIGFVNLDDADGLVQTIQSGIVGYLSEGIYTLTVAVGARPSTSWNDVRYEISLVADPVLGEPDNKGPALGSRDGTVLGTPATVTLVCSTAVLGQNNQDLTYVLKVDAADPNMDPNLIGAPFAIRISVLNSLAQNGVPDDGTNGGTVDPGTNYRFTQGNFDNVRLDYVQVVDLKAVGINADFDDWLAVGNDGAKWASEITSNDLNGDGLNDMYDALLTDDEFYTNPSSFGSGWQSNGTAGLNGKYGLQHPKRSAQNDMSAPFNGDFIGFVNLDDADGLVQTIQSGIVGYLSEGIYTLTVAVGARPSTSWNDVRYEISLVADPVLGEPDNKGPALGSRDGTVLGTSATVTLVCSTAVLGQNNQDLTYVLKVDAADPNMDPNLIGAPFAIRISVLNSLAQNGVPDDGTNGGTVDPGTNYRFTQGNFDNVRLLFGPPKLPEPEAVEEPPADEGVVEPNQP